MIVRIVRLHIDEARSAAFDALFWQHRDAIASQPGCLGVELMSVKDQPGVRATLSRWESVDALNAYRASKVFGEVWPATKALFADAPEVWTYELEKGGDGAIFGP